MIDTIEIDEQANPGQNQGGQDQDSQRGANQPRRDDKDQDQERNRQKQDQPGQGKRSGQGGQEDEEEG